MTEENTGVNFSEGESFQVDLNEVEDNAFPVLPKGLYPCVISDCEFTISQSGGNPMWTMALEVQDGEYAGTKLFCHYVFAGKGLPITKQNLARIAPELLEGPFDPQDPEIQTDMIGREVKAKVTVKKYEGEDRNNVRGLWPNDSGGFL